MGRIVCAIGVTLLMCNVVGFWAYTTISEIKEPQAFVIQAQRYPNEGLDRYASRLAAMLRESVVHADPGLVKPTFFENYILWGYSNYLGYWEWTDTIKALRCGGGYCSQRAIIFNNIMLDQGISSRILGLGTHVLNEVLIGDRWVMFDPSFSEWVFDEDLASAEDNWHFKSSFQYSIRKSEVEYISAWMIWVLPLALLLIGTWAKR